MILLQATITDTLTRFFVYCSTWSSWIGHVFFVFLMLFYFLGFHDLYAEIKKTTRRILPRLAPILDVGTTQAKRRKSCKQ